ncbi:MAG: trehalose-phosphatase [bacterium]
MKYLLKDLENIQTILKDKNIFLFLDYDGTLTPIVDNPKQAALAQETSDLLNQLSKKSGLILAIISGRALEDIKKKVGIEGIIYAGNHGLEAEGPGIIFKSLVSRRAKAIIKHIKDNLTQKFSIIKGILVEDKKLTLSIHYRLIEKGKRPLLKKLLVNILQPYYNKNKIIIKKGKMVIEIRPSVEWDKGKIVLWLLERQRIIFNNKIRTPPVTNEVLPIYIGDDLTDEDAFKTIKGKGLTVVVGKKRVSEAEYYLKNVNDVLKFLREVDGKKK